MGTVVSLKFPPSSTFPPGPTSSRSDSQSVSEGGEVSPASQPGAFPWDAAGTSPSETAVEEAQDKDR